MAGLFNALRRAAALLLTLVPAALFSTAAQSAPWWHDLALDVMDTHVWRLVGSDSYAQIRRSVHAPSMFRNGETAGVWVRTDHFTPMRLSDGRSVHITLAVVEVSCATKAYAIRETRYLNAAGFVLQVKDHHAGEPTQQARPGSHFEQIAEMACGAKEGQGGADEDQGGSGTGWLAARGYLVTASHVVDGAKKVAIYQEGRRLGQAEVVRDDPANDVAVLKPLFDTSPYAAIRISTTPAVLGQRVFSLGYPESGILGSSTVKMTAGDVSSLAGFDIATRRSDDRRFLQVSVPLQRGNSGGPVFGPDGAVVGIVSSKITRSNDGDILQNVNFALKASYVSSLVDELPAIGRAKVSTVRGDTATIVAGVQSGVFLVVVGETEEDRRQASAGK